ncbi:hypothetical protein [Sedimentibacter sp.]|uniref:hypothetical protein n=1 Tax=Sedimentibacter sp. TaxID=1960295 RepID=UPI0028B091F7|nr:hypothetical protein [Sedimentibacter sp.]
MKQNVIVTFVKGYRMENDSKTGYNEGISIHYLLTDNLSPVVGNDERGIRFSKSSISLEKGKQIIKVPGLYEADFEMKSDAQGKILLKLKDLAYLSEVQTLYPEIKK